LSPRSRDPVVDLIGRRTRAGWIDVAICFVYFVIIAAITGGAHVGNWTTTLSDGTTVRHSGAALDLGGIGFLIWAVVSLFYSFAAELLRGQTVGKSVMGLKVITLSGVPLSPGVVGLRTLGRIIDVLPAFYLLGWILMRGPHRPPQRLGDRLAGTTVVPVGHP
jgi:uncharacterized RDD family membrane protein YckC